MHKRQPKFPAMTLERLHILSLLLACTLFVASPVAAQTKEGKGQTAANAAPVVTDCWPRSGSVDSVIELKGFRLGAGELESAKAFFIQNGFEIPAQRKGGSGVTNDRLNGPQTLDVIVPEEVVPGPAQIVLERTGFRSAPVTIT